MSLHVFIDCEFTDLASPQLLAIGLVTDDGRELYAELGDASHWRRASTFVLDTVVPQFGLVPYQEASLIDIGHRVGDWLLQVGSTPILVCYDYHADMDLLEYVLKLAGRWWPLEPMLQPTHLGYLLGDPDVEVAMRESWAASFRKDGTARHHALADARALGAGFGAMHPLS